MLAVGSCMALPAFAEAVDLEAFAGLPRVSAAVDGSVRSWRTLGMRVATDWLSRRIALPPFEVWLDDYRAHPDRYEEYFMGLWQADANEPTDP